MDNRQFAMLKDYLYRSYMAECIGNIYDSIAYRKLRTYKLFKESLNLKITFHPQKILITH